MSRSPIDDDAVARWAIRLDGPPLSDAEQSELDAWLLADELRGGALLRAEAALAYLDGAALVSAEQFEADAGDRPGFGRRAFFVGGSAAALVAASVFGLILMQPKAVEVQTFEILTGIGEVRRVELADGSVASVNTDSKVEIEMYDDRRRAILVQGEVWFQVAHDQDRPFVVEAGGVRVQALGTAFAVRKHEDGADVAVNEGAVEAWIIGHEIDSARIAAGSMGFIADTALSIRVMESSDDVERALAWRNGEIALNGESLNYAVLEFNRYNTRKLVIDGDRLGREPLVGYFRTDDPETFGRAAASMLGARIEVEGDTIRLSR